MPGDRRSSVSTVWRARNQFHTGTEAQALTAEPIGHMRESCYADIDVENHDENAAGLKLAQSG